MKRAIAWLREWGTLWFFVASFSYAGYRGEEVSYWYLACAVGLVMFEKLKGDAALRLSDSKHDLAEYYRQKADEKDRVIAELRNQRPYR